MKESDVETIVQRTLARYPGVIPRTIIDSGPQFIARDFKKFIRICGMKHVKTSPYYPQSNGKIERWYRSIKSEGIRPGSPLSEEDSIRLFGGYVRHYNEVRLHSAIGYVLLWIRWLVATNRSSLIAIASSSKQGAIDRQFTPRNAKLADAIWEQLLMSSRGFTTASGLGGGQGSVATQPERRPRDQDRKKGGTKPPCIPHSGLVPSDKSFLTDLFLNN